MKAGWLRALACVLLGRALLGWTPAGAWGVDSVDVCAICGKDFVKVYYSIEDQVTLEKKHICSICEQSFPVCFICGLPADADAAGGGGRPGRRARGARGAGAAGGRGGGGGAGGRGGRD